MLVSSFHTDGQDPLRHGPSPQAPPAPQLLSAQHSVRAGTARLGDVHGVVGRKQRVTCQSTALHSCKNGKPFKHSGEREAEERGNS